MIMKAFLWGFYMSLPCFPLIKFTLQYKLFHYTTTNPPLYPKRGLVQKPHPISSRNNATASVRISKVALRKRDSLKLGYIGQTVTQNGLDDL